MKKGPTLGIVIIVLIILIGGGYALMHKSSKKPVAASAASSTSSKTSSNAPAVNNSVLVTKTSSSLGQYLAEPNGQPLYTYGGDKNGVSNCTGTCLATWPAYQDKGSTTGLPAGVSTIKRTDNGEIQFTYNGMPLYTFVSDSNGQVTGNGVTNFTIAKPASSSSSPSSTSNSQSGSQSSSSNSSSPSNGNSSGYPY